VLNVILGQHNKPKAAVHSVELTGPLKKKKKKKKKKKTAATTPCPGVCMFFYEKQENVRMM
jgi:hypothetical protein